MNTATVLRSAVANKTTDELFAILDVLDAKPSKDEADRAVSAAASDEISDRHNLGAKLDAIYDDLDYEGTYTEALRKAMAA